MAKAKCTITSCEDIFKGRRSIRAYEDKPVPKEMIEALIESACLAPSTLNAQPWYFTVIQGERREAILSLLRRSSLYLEDTLALLDADARDEFKKHVTPQEQEHVMAFFDSLGNAPAIVVVTTKKLTNDVLRRMALISCAAAVENLMLAASCYGLGTCCVGSALWTEEELLQQLDIADGELVTIISLGYPAEYPGPAEPRKSPITWIGP
jgi:nitroreductase